MHRLLIISLLSVLLWSDFGWIPASHSIAPPRSGQPYAESICNTDPNIIFCEDFNYPQNFVFSGVVDRNNSNWINPGLTTGLFGFIYGLDGRRINPATQYPSKPSGVMPSGAQADHVWVANFDSTKGATGNGSTWGKLREPGGNYANGTPPAKDVYIRFQYYVTADYAWPGDPKTGPYNYGAGCQAYDNKILYIFPPEGIDNPTNASYDAGLHTQAGLWDPNQNARFADALGVRYGSASDNYKYAPLCAVCSFNPNFYNYGPFQSLTLRNPNDSTVFGRAFRFNTNRWYTIEMRYKLSSRDVADGLVEVWIDGTKVYSFSGIRTCESGIGDCSGIGAIYIGAYHNGLDCTRWSGQQVVDNLVISRSYIGPPSGSGDATPPAAPANLRIQ